MKTISNYIGIVFALLSVALFAGGCGDDYEYDTDYSFYYNKVNLKIDLVDRNNVLNLNLINGTYVLKVNVTPEDIVIPPEGYLYTIEDETVATIKNDGTLTMLKAGETKLTVKFRGNREVFTSCTVKISPILTDELKVPASITVEEKKTLELLPQITTVPSQASKKFTYSVKDNTIATVSEDGVVTGGKPGQTVITVTTTDGTNISKDITVEVVGKIFIENIKLPADKVNGKEFVVGQVLNIGKFMEIVPSNASEPVVEFSVSDGGAVVNVTKEGVVTCKAAGTATISAEAKDGSGKKQDLEITVVASGWYERSLWTIDTSYRHEVDGKVYNFTADKAEGAPERILDGNNSTYFALIKPEKGSYSDSGSGITFPAQQGDQFFVVDMGAKTEFNKFKWTHRNSTKGMQVWDVSLFGSDDGQNFTPIQENISIGNTSTVERTFDIPLSNYRYIKAQFMKWDPANNSNITIAEFNVCKE